MDNLTAASTPAATAEFKFKVEVLELLKGLKKIGRALGKSKDPDMLRNVNCDVSGQGLFITATNGLVIARALVPLYPRPYNGQPFQFYISGAELRGLVNTARGGVVDFSLKADGSGKAKASILVIRDGLEAGLWQTHAIIEVLPQFEVCVPENFGVRIRREELVKAIGQCLMFVKKKLESVATGTGGKSPSQARKESTYGLHFRDSSIEAGTGRCFCVVNFRTGAPGEPPPLFPNVTISPEAAALILDMAKMSGAEYVHVLHQEADGKVLLRMGDDLVGLSTIDVLWLDLVEKLIKPVETTRQAIFSASRKPLLEWLSKAGVYGAVVTLTNKGRALELRSEDGNGRISAHPLPVTWKIAGDYRLRVSSLEFARLVASAPANEFTLLEGVSQSRRRIVFMDQRVFQAYCMTAREAPLADAGAAPQDPLNTLPHEEKTPGGKPS